jgi:hypothetical protein
MAELPRGWICREIDIDIMSSLNPEPRTHITRARIGGTNSIVLVIYI